MEPRDYENLKFILSRTPEELYGWWNDLDDEDRQYAVDIVKQYAKELREDVNAITKLIKDEYSVEEEIDTTQAKDYLKKFQLQK